VTREFPRLLVDVFLTVSKSAPLGTRSVRVVGLPYESIQVVGGVFILVLPDGTEEHYSAAYSFLSIGPVYGRTDDWQGSEFSYLDDAPPPPDLPGVD